MQRQEVDEKGLLSAGALARAEGFVFSPYEKSHLALELDAVTSVTYNTCCYTANLFWRTSHSSSSTFVGAAAAGEACSPSTWRPPIGIKKCSQAYGPYTGTSAGS